MFLQCNYWQCQTVQQVKHSICDTRVQHWHILRRRHQRHGIDVCQNLRRLRGVNTSEASQIAWVKTRLCPGLRKAKFAVTPQRKIKHIRICAGIGAAAVMRGAARAVERA